MQNKKYPWVILLMSSMLISGAYAKEAQDTKGLKEVEKSSSASDKADKKKVSYGIGVDIGRNFKRLDLDLDLTILAKGLKDAKEGKKLDLSEDELRIIMSNYQNELKQKQITALKRGGFVLYLINYVFDK